MNTYEKSPPAINVDTMLDDTAAELTQSACAVAHAHLTELHGVQPPWLELKLALWNALRRTVAKWSRPTHSLTGTELDEWREGYLADLADAAHRTVLCFCVRESFREAQLSLQQTFRTMIEANERTPRWHERPASCIP